jgi:starch phosphorylase
MAYLAVRGSGGVNEVSQLHRQVSRRIFQVLFPRWPEIEVPITHVTNGVHTPTWDSALADDLWEDVCGKGRGHGATEGMEHQVRKVSDSDLWQLRTDSRKALVQYVRKQHAQQVSIRGASQEEVAKAAQVLDPDVLTLGFAR